MREINHLRFRLLVSTLRSARDNVAANNGEFNCQSIKREHSFLAALRRSITKSPEFPAVRYNRASHQSPDIVPEGNCTSKALHDIPYAIDKHPVYSPLVNIKERRDRRGKFDYFGGTCAVASAGSGTSVHGDLSQLRGRTYLLNAVETSRLYVILFPFSLSALCRLSVEHQAMPSRRFLSYSFASPSRPIPRSRSCLVSVAVELSATFHFN